MVNTMEYQTSEQAIASIIAGTLKEHRDVSVQGLGSFSVHHQSQDHRQEKDGRILLDPPSDIIIFTPEK